jgi:hypothetical protein
MKSTLASAVALIVTLGLAGTAVAQARHDEKPHGYDKAKAQAAATQAVSSTSVTTPMGQMDEHMRKMQALHDRMMSAATPEERQKLMEEQRREMHAGMAMLNGMQGGTMMGGTGAGTMGAKSKPADPGAQMQMMQKRMDMMQMMMQSMMDQQGMMSGPKGPDAAPKK